MDQICSIVSETLIEYHKQCEERESAMWEGLLLHRKVLPSSSIRTEELTQQNICHPSPTLASAEGGELRGARRPPPHNKPHFQMLPAAHWINIFPRQGREESPLSLPGPSLPLFSSRPTDRRAGHVPALHPPIWYPQRRLSARIGYQMVMSGRTSEININAGGRERGEGCNKVM